MAYRKAIGTLKGVKEPIKSSKQVSSLPGIGKKIADKIDEYFANGGKFREVAAPFKADKMKGIEELKRIWGVGDVKAVALYNKGFHSVADLRKKGGEDQLTSLQKIGLKYFEDLDQKIPRD